ncbi:MAG TPA: YfiR family protein [Steroidobacteraceae bacterium]
MGLLRSRARAVAAAALIAAGLLLAARPALAEPTAQQVEAVFLFYFSQFVDWPASAFADERSPIVIGVLGDDPFGGALDQAVAGERVNGRPVVVRRLRSIAAAADCHILYISSSEAPQLQQILSALKGHNVLTVSDLERFAQSGGMIRFVLIDQHVRLIVNARAARAAGLKLSSKLLRAAAPARPGEG